MKIKGSMELMTTFNMNVLESKIDRFKSLTKQSIERNTVVDSVVYQIGLNIEVTLSGNLTFIEREAETIYV